MKRKVDNRRVGDPLGYAILGFLSSLALVILLSGCGDQAPEQASAPQPFPSADEYSGGSGSAAPMIYTAPPESALPAKDMPPRVAAMEAPPMEVEEESKEFQTVDVFFGTDRKATENPGPNNQYGPERNRQGDLDYGKTTVSIPRHHQLGVVERPKWYKLEFSENPKKHVVIMELAKLERDVFFQSLKEKGSASPQKEGLLFVHGFNVGFDDAIRRTAQIAFDLDFGGVALCYSWPSQASLRSYTVDETNAEWAFPHLSKFLLDIQENTDLEKIHIIAHSMGTRVLSYALKNARDSNFNLKVNNVVLAAPDIDVDIFRDQILPKIRGMSDTLTMYASSDDAALKISREIHGNDRLGLSGNLMLVVEGMDTIDASGIDTSMIGHAYYGSHKRVVEDIFGLLIKGLAPMKRNLVNGPIGEWGFGPAQPIP